MSASLWDLNWRLVLNFVLFLYQLDWSQGPLSVQARGYSFQNAFLGV